MQVLILGGSGRIGSNVAADLLAHTSADIVIAGRNPSGGEKLSQQLGERVKFAIVELSDPLSHSLNHGGVDRDRLEAAISSADLVIHCAGPFLYRDTSVLEICIARGVNYIDVSDHPSFTRKALAHRAAAEAAGVTAVVNTGIFPGISNSMVRRDVEQLDKPEKIHLSYVVAGSGGAGVTVMRTTFLGLQRPFQAWLEGQWQTVKPYSDREVVEFPTYGKVGVYWFDMPEAFTLPATFPVESVVTKFGTVPQFYNHLTWSVARWWHPKLLQARATIEFLSRVSHFMTDVSDRFSGVGVAIRSEVTGQKNGQTVRCCSTLVESDTAVAAGAGTGTVAALILSEKLKKPGVWAVEQALPTDMFEGVMRDRGIEIQQHLSPM
ncbi:saccharopine dehydrogenase family protein [Myxacorys almedinensis]|uniref:Saccharopine dehydrogenase n=1 Tax=Myxacorys almedinensis A TaxID=2690445 RepID=A0A8J7Z470_9CYAN|nr:saccharopine dehydrogenase NADP-binding domain-containing protein [Myxacorys almedinensis]NDJ19672.1 saccharopine dehydrogenase [Myxacorys almedinensis A]